MTARFHIVRAGVIRRGFRWRLIAGNGEPLATSEMYTRKDDAVRGMGDMGRAVIDAAQVEYRDDT